MYQIHQMYTSNININNINWYTYAARVATFYICWILFLAAVEWGSGAGNIKP